MSRALLELFLVMVDVCLILYFTFSFTESVLWVRRGEGDARVRTGVFHCGTCWMLVIDD